MTDHSMPVSIARQVPKFAGAKSILLAVCALLLSCVARVDAAPLRRPLSTTSPMWLIHVNYPSLTHPQTVIDAIPADIRPYVVLNLAMSAAVDTGYETMDAWLNSCAQHGMYAMVQPSSGVDNSMSDTDLVPYETLYQKYPSLIGYNFCEQAWGFGAASFASRLELYAKLLELGDKYGGYLYVNDCFSLSNSSWNTVAKFKASQRFRDTTKTYKANFIFGNKYTHSYGYYDNESGALGAYLSGHAGHYAVRFDQFAWGWSGKAQVFGEEYPDRAEFGVSPLLSCPEAVAGVPIVEQMLLNGASVIDGPEIPDIANTFKGRATPMFINMIGDILRKAVDGSIRIPTLPEVAARAKIGFVPLSSTNPPADLYTGLYEMDGQQNQNRTWFKKSGRYPTIPVLFTNEAYETSLLSTHVTSSEYAVRWPTQASKVSEFDSLFPPQATGDLFVARVGNKLLTYNPHINTDVATSASIPLQYNTASQINLTYPAHTFGVITETDQGLNVYLNNYRTDKSAIWAAYPAGIGYSSAEFASYMNAHIAAPEDSLLRETVLQVAGATTEPTFTLTERGSHKPSTATATWSNGVYTLTIAHNGPVDVAISCAGAGTDRLPVPATVSITPPAALAPYKVLPYQLVRAAGFAVGSGVGMEACSEGGLDVNAISNGDWILLRQVDFSTGANSFIARVAGIAGGAIELRLDSEFGPVIGTCAVPATGGAQNWATTSCAVDSALTQGVHDLYLRFTGGAGAAIFGLNWFQFGSPSTPLTAPTDLSGYSVPPSDAVLTWTGAIDAAGYNVKRSLNSGGPYATIATNVANPTYTDMGLSMGLTYYYVVSKVNASQESPDSGETSVRMARQLFPVADASVRDGGSANSNFGTAVDLAVKLDPTANSGLSREAFLRFNVSGLANVASAQLRLTPVSVGSTVAQINYEFVPTDTWTESGVTWNTKPASSGSFGSITGYTPKVPVRINVLSRTRTEAAGDTQLSVRAYSPLSGSNRFVFFASKEAPVSSERPCIEYLLAGPAKPTGLIAAASSAQVGLSWDLAPDAMSYLVKRSSSAGGPYKIVASGLTSPNFTDVGLVEDQPVFYVVSALGSENQSEDSAELALVLGSPRPRVHLRLDETGGTTASDSSGNGWTGALVNGPTWVGGADARINGALKLDGTNDHVTLPAGVVSALNECTISFWVKLTTVGTWSRVFDFGFGNTNTTMYFTPRASSSTGPARFAIKVNNTSQNLESTSALPANAWTHVLITLSGNTGKMYVNGGLVATNTAMTFRPSNMGTTSVNYLGRSQSTSDPHLNGTLDEFKIFGRALLPSEITTLATPPPPPAITGPTSASALYGTDFNYAIAATQSPTSFSATGLPPGLSLDGATGIISGRPAALGDFSVTLQASNAGGTGTATLALAVSPAPVTITLNGLAPVYNRSPQAVTGSTQPAGVSVAITYDGNPNPPTDAGNYAVAATSVDPNYIGSATGTLVIAPATAIIQLAPLSQRYDGAPKTVIATTTPAGLNIELTYDGNTTAPIYPGTYAVAATIDDANYIGTASDSLVVTITAIVRHAPTIRGTVDGSVQMLLGENVALSGYSTITGDLLVPGMPAALSTGNALYAGELDGPGSTSASNYSVALSGNALLRYLVRRIDPLVLPNVSAPPAPLGTRSVSLTLASQSAGDFATLRNLMLNGSAGLVTVPPGTYGNFVANGKSGFVLGVAGATEPAAYNFQNLSINPLLGAAQLKIVGPVIVTVANNVTIFGATGSAAHPEWLTLRVSSGGLTVTGKIVFHGSVLAPNGSVTLGANSTVNGSVTADRLTINANALLNEPTQ